MIEDNTPFQKGSDRNAEICSLKFADFHIC